MTPSTSKSTRPARCGSRRSTPGYKCGCRRSGPRRRHRRRRSEPPWTYSSRRRSRRRKSTTRRSKPPRDAWDAAAESAGWKFVRAVSEANWCFDNAGKIASFNLLVSQIEAEAAFDAASYESNALLESALRDAEADWDAAHTEAERVLHADADAALSGWLEDEQRAFDENRSAFGGQASRYRLPDPASRDGGDPVGGVIGRGRQGAYAAVGGRGAYRENFLKTLKDGLSDVFDGDLWHAHHRHEYNLRNVMRELGIDLHDIDSPRNIKLLNAQVHEQITGRTRHLLGWRSGHRAAPPQERSEY